jgi:hypothetical protein
MRRGFDHVDAKGAPAKVRLSELFRPGTDTLIIYHFMFPRHRGDKRRGPHRTSPGRTRRLEPEPASGFSGKGGCVRIPSNRAEAGQCFGF